MHLWGRISNFPKATQKVVEGHSIVANVDLKFTQLVTTREMLQIRNYERAPSFLHAKLPS